VRGLIRTVWIPWRALGRRMPKVAADTMLGIYGPFGLLSILGLLSMGVILCFSGMHWAAFSHLDRDQPARWAHDLYFSAATFFSANTTAIPRSGLGELLQVFEAATGYAVLFISIGYLPALFQAFSRRETAVSRLDPRAGSPPSAGTLLERSGERGGWEELDAYLREWETWTAELMETHLSYPILGYFRSQHVNQNWLAALTTIVDACAFAIAYGPEEAIDAAELTFRVGRHALADLAYAFSTRRVRKDPELGRERLSEERLAELCRALEGKRAARGGDSGVQRAPGEAAHRLRAVRDRDLAPAGAGSSRVGPFGRGAGELAPGLDSPSGPEAAALSPASAQRDEAAFSR